MESDRYEIIGRLGEGGMSNLYVGKDLKEGKQVILKTLLEDEDGKCWEREFDILSGLSHPNIVKAIEKFSLRDRLFFAMEKINGTSLFKALPPSDGASLGKLALSVFGQLQNVLDFIHEHGIVHGELSPGNLLVDERGTLKIIDFEFCVTELDMAESGVIVGTAAYMSPEHVTTLRLLPESDYFVVGTLLLEYLYGSNPFHCAEESSTFERILDIGQAEIVSMLPTIKGDLLGIITFLLAKEPHSRRQGWKLLHEATEPYSSFTASSQLVSGETTRPEKSLGIYKVGDKGIATKISILFLAADPTDGSRLRLGEEYREIQEKLQLARLRERFALHQRMSVRAADISQALLDVQPQIVHFSGHGRATGALCFENQLGSTHPIRPDALAALFEQFANQLNCVVLNACYSKSQADAIARHISYVVGMNQAIGDKACIAFAVGFYQALGAGRQVEEAYKLGCVQIRLQGISEHLTPVLIKKGQTQR